ncbi:MAG: DUF2318 domain-containing protein, partial [Deferribacteraceae bacterium]|nr:DUF2318 domain-containing protein [Deferribacteraceae bacterium]
MRSILVLLVSILMLVGCSGGDPMKSKSMPKAEAMTAAGDQLTFTIADYDDGKAHYYSFNANGKTIRFFLVKASDNVVRAAFDACDVCFREKKGYRQDGN